MVVAVHGLDIGHQIAKHTFGSGRAANIAETDKEGFLSHVDLIPYWLTLGTK